MYLASELADSNVYDCSAYNSHFFVTVWSLFESYHTVLTVGREAPDNGRCEMPSRINDSHEQIFRENHCHNQPLYYGRSRGKFDLLGYEIMDPS